MSARDYQLETVVASAQPDAWPRWYAAFQMVYERWQLDRAEQLLRLIKTQPITQRQQGVVRYLTGRLRVHQDRWPEALTAYQQALAPLRAAGAQRDALMVLTGLANLLRRVGRPAVEIIEAYRQALDLAIDLGDEGDRAYVLNGTGLLLEEDNDFEPAQAAFDRALAAAQTYGAADDEALVRLNALPLPELSEDESKAYLRHYGLTDPAALNHIYQFIGGYPLLLVLVRHLAREAGGWEQVGTLQSNADSRFCGHTAAGAHPARGARPRGTCVFGAWRRRAMVRPRDDQRAARRRPRRRPTDLRQAAAPLVRRAPPQRPQVPRQNTRAAAGATSVHEPGRIPAPQPAPDRILCREGRHRPGDIRRGEAERSGAAGGAQARAARAWLWRVTPPACISQRTRKMA
jgi:tetratricopeptide (TPR) repeat protein